MAQPKTLNAKQIEVLRWIAGGCPIRDGSNFFRISAGALRNRGLVVTKGRGETWSASITPTGIEYLTSVDGPHPPKVRGPNVSVTEQLVAEAVAAGGALVVPRLSNYDQNYVDYQLRARLAEQHQKVPTGKQLRVHHISGTETRIEITDLPEGIAGPDAPVDVPTAVSRYHSVVREFKEMSDRHEVSRDSLPRLLRILQGLVVEAERRGFKAELVPDPKPTRSYSGDEPWSGPKHGHLLLSMKSHLVRIRFSEEGLPSRTYWMRHNGRWSYRGGGAGTWTRPSLSEYEANGTGRLIMEFVPDYSHNGRIHRWSDRKAWKIENKLSELLRGVELRIADAEAHAREAAQIAERHRLAEEEERKRAKERAAYKRQADELANQIDRWEEARRIRTYCLAMADGFPREEKTTKWIRWAEAHADSIDPLRSPPQGVGDEG